jgi:hypothetical protein
MKDSIQAVICITTKKSFKSYAEAGNYYGIDPCNIRKNCLGIRNSAGKIEGNIDEKNMKWMIVEIDSQLFK